MFTIKIDGRCIWWALCCLQTCMSRYTLESFTFQRYMRKRRNTFLLQFIAGSTESILLVKFIEKAGAQSTAVHFHLKFTNHYARVESCRLCAITISIRLWIFSAATSIHRLHIHGTTHDSWRLVIRLNSMRTYHLIYTLPETTIRIEIKYRISSSESISLVPNFIVAFFGIERTINERKNLIFNEQFGSGIFHFWRPSQTLCADKIFSVDFNLVTVYIRYNSIYWLLRFFFFLFS